MLSIITIDITEGRTRYMVVREASEVVEQSEAG
jgi:hypothetical protein